MKNSNHTQSTAYLVGETAAEKMIEEYALDSSGTASTRRDGGSGEFRSSL